MARYSWILIYEPPLSAGRWRGRDSAGTGPGTWGKPENVTVTGPLLEPWLSGEYAIWGET